MLCPPNLSKKELSPRTWTMESSPPSLTYILRLRWNVKTKKRKELKTLPKETPRNGFVPKGSSNSNFNQNPRKRRAFSVLWTTISFPFLPSWRGFLFLADWIQLQKKTKGASKGWDPKILYVGLSGVLRKNKKNPGRQFWQLSGACSLPKWTIFISQQFRRRLPSPFPSIHRETSLLSYLVLEWKRMTIS